MRAVAEAEREGVIGNVTCQNGERQTQVHGKGPFNIWCSANFLTSNSTPKTEKQGGKGNNEASSRLADAMNHVDAIEDQLALVKAATATGEVQVAQHAMTSLLASGREALSSLRVARYPIIRGFGGGFGGLSWCT